MGREDVLAGRIAMLRQASSPPMSYETLARRMAAVGCPIQPSALQRVEKGSPRRKVTVDELVAFAQVFGTSMEELIALPETDIGEQVESALRAYRQAMLTWQSARERLAASVVEEEMAFKVLEGRRKTLLGWRQRLDASVHPDSPETNVSRDDLSAFRLFLAEVGDALDSGAAPRRIHIPLKTEAKTT